jgi:hypothetical protein
MALATNGEFPFRLEGKSSKYWFFPYAAVERISRENNVSTLEAQPLVVISGGKKLVGTFPRRSAM